MFPHNILVDSTLILFALLFLSSSPVRMITLFSPAGTKWSPTILIPVNSDPATAPLPSELGFWKLTIQHCFWSFFWENLLPCVYEKARIPLEFPSFLYFSAVSLYHLEDTNYGNPENNFRKQKTYMNCWISVSHLICNSKYVTKLTQAWSCAQYGWRTCGEE